MIMIDVDLTKVAQSDELVFEIIASMIHMGIMLQFNLALIVPAAVT